MTNDIREIKYQRARNYLDEDNYESVNEAISLLKELDDFKDSKRILETIALPRFEALEKERIEQIEDDYYRANLLMKKKSSAYRLDQAMKLFLELGEYKDSKEKYEECKSLREKVFIGDKKGLSRIRKLGYVFAGFGVIAVVFIIFAMIWQTVTQDKEKEIALLNMILLFMK